jgi:nitrogen regulatory protein P-II 1
MTKRVRKLAIRRNAMKRIEIIIKPSSVEDLKQALTEAGVTGLTLSDVRTMGGQKSRQFYRGTEYVVDLLPKVRLEILVPNDFVNRVVKIIRSLARSAHLGDETGTILVFPVEAAHSVFSVATTVG